MATERAEKYGITVRVPRPGLCTDNGAMLALGSRPGGRWSRTERTGPSSRFGDAADAGKCVMTFGEVSDDQRCPPGGRPH